MKYAVHIPVTGYFNIELEAANEQEAKEIAELRFDDEAIAGTYHADDFVAVECDIYDEMLAEEVDDT